MKPLIAVCGLDCQSCDARIATVTDDDKLREKTAKLWSELNGVPITAEQIHCMGCRTEGVKTVFCGQLCPIRKCAMARGAATCGDCPELNRCATVGAVLQNAPQAKENLLAEAAAAQSI